MGSNQQQGTAQVVGRPGRGRGSCALGAGCATAPRARCAGRASRSHRIDWPRAGRHAVLAGRLAAGHWLLTSAARPSLRRGPPGI